MARRDELRTLARCAAAGVLAAAPVLSPAHADRGGFLRASICADGGRRIIEIDFGGEKPGDDGRHAPCHAACLADRKAGKPRAPR